jgi:hypothetical protein
MNDLEAWKQRFLTDQRSTDELLSLAINKDIDADNDDYWDPIRCLQYRLSSICSRIEPMLENANPKHRDVAATIFGQNSVKEKWDVPYCADLLLSAINRETSAEVLTSIIHALGNLNDSRRIEAVLPFANHPGSNVRYAVVHCISGLSDHRAIQALIQLSTDTDRDVRNWATFGIASLIDTDTKEIREALVARLNEKDDEIRGEAFIGLAIRGDASVIPAFLRELDEQDSEVLRQWTLVVDAADAIIENVIKNGNPVWLPVIERLRALEIGDSSKLEIAIKAVKPKN